MGKTEKTLDIRIKVAEEMQKKWLDPSEIKGWLAGYKRIPQEAQEQIAQVIQALFAEYGLRPDLGHIVILGDRPYVTREGLLYYARRSGELKGIKVEIVEKRKDFCLVKAKVITKDGGEFEAFGDADIGNTNRMVSPHLIRMAETRAINRALREAFPIGLCSYEELAEQDIYDPETGEVLNIEGETKKVIQPSEEGKRMEVSDEGMDLMDEIHKESKQEEKKVLDKKYITAVHSWSSLAKFDYKSFIKERFKKESSKELTESEAKLTVLEAKKKWYNDLFKRGINPVNRLNKALHKITYQEAKKLMEEIKNA